MEAPTMDATIINDDAVTTVDDVTRAVDDLAARVVWMDMDERQRQAVLDALSAAISAIQKTQ
jgi:hypothetical protein